MTECTECGTTYTSRLAAEECSEMDAEDQRRQRAWTKAHEIVKGQVRDKA